MSRDNLSNDLAGKLRTQILRGKWPVGSALPSTRELAREHNVSPNTIHGVLRELAAQGLVDLQPRRGRFVRANTPPAPLSILRAVQVVVVRPTEHGPHREARTQWTSNIISAMEDVFVTEGLRVTLLSYPICNSHWSDWVIEQVEERRTEFAGVVAFANGEMGRVVHHLKSTGMPWLTINRCNEHQWENSIAADNHGAGRLVGDIFAELGFRRIVLVGCPTPSQSSACEKMTGLLQSFLTRGEPLSGIEVAACSSNVSDESTGYEAMRDFLSRRRGEPPEAIFCTGDLLAIGAIRACQEAGLRVPDDVSVIGGTGTDVGAYTRPPLTTMAQPMSEMGRRAGLMLLRMINEKISELPAERLACKLILRSSLRTLPEAFRDQVVD